MFSAILLNNTLCHLIFSIIYPLLQFASVTIIKRASISYLVSVDETWVNCFEPERTSYNKINPGIKDCKRLALFKDYEPWRQFNMLFFLAIKAKDMQIYVPKGKPITGNFYLNVVLKN